MKRLSTAVVLALFGLAPVVTAACEMDDETSASASPPAQLGLAAAPAASKAPAPAGARANAVKAAKQGVDKAKPVLSDAKVAAVATGR